VSINIQKDIEQELDQGLEQGLKQEVEKSSEQETGYKSVHKSGTKETPISLWDITRKVCDFLKHHAGEDRAVSVAAGTDLGAVSAPVASPQQWIFAKSIAQHHYGLTPLEWACALQEKTINGTAITMQDFHWFWAHPEYADAPLSRIVGYGWFCGRRFDLNEATLDPRWESEGIIDIVEQYCPHFEKSPRGGIRPEGILSKKGTPTESAFEKGSSAVPSLAVLSQKGAPRILDIGTGSGCLLISLLLTYPDAMGCGTDISRTALQAARKNAHRHGVAQRSIWLHSNGLACFEKNDGGRDGVNRAECTGPGIRAVHASALETLVPEMSALETLVPEMSALETLVPEQWDIIVSNPPYVPSAFPLPNDVKKWDPALALYGGHDGLDLYRAWIQPITEKLAHQGVFVLEIGYDQGPPVWRLCQQAGFIHGGIQQDADGKDRYVWAVKIG